MSTLPAILQSSRLNLYSGALMATIYVFFVYAHFTKFLETSSLSLLLVIISETLTIVFFVCRSNPKTVSIIPYDWMVAIVGSFAPLFLRPGEQGVLPQAEVLIALGTLLQIAGLISLNRSFALVAAKRQIKTKWMYGIIRHPLYASYLLVFGGYVLVHTSIANLIVFTIMMTFLCLRIFREEEHLSLDPQYRNYMQKVRYRIIPYVF
ncbi:MAG: isoprenylcysteine carboxylmethyltransferase family protein [Nitrosomonas sp.]|nr:isoprenylcysteine carboxylmethyltransferase family protein [Nitrosomonas sp.]